MRITNYILGIVRGFGTIQNTCLIRFMVAFVSVAIFMLLLPYCTFAQIPEELTLGKPMDGKLLQAKGTKYYLVYVKAGNHLLVTLDGLNKNDKIELYIKYGVLPTRTVYDGKYGIDDNPDQAVHIANTKEGYYFIMVYAAYIYNDGSFTITANTDPFLTLGLPSSDKLYHAKALKYYMVRVDSGKHLIVSLDGANANDKIELYIKYDSLPTIKEKEYDDKSKEIGPDQALDIPETKEGFYYILVYAAYIYDDGSFTIFTGIPGVPLPIIIVEPNPATVEIGTTLQFTAVVRDYQGKAIPVQPTWTTDAGKIDANGLLTADTKPIKGKSVTATVGALPNSTTTGISGKAIVDIVDAILNPVFTRIEITPSNTKLAPDEAQKFTAKGYDQYNKEIASLSVNWSVVNGGGAIDSSGIFKAGKTLGVFTDTVKAEININGVTKFVYASVTIEKPSDNFTANIPLVQGVNIISLPLKPSQTYIASSLAANLGSTIVIRAEKGLFDAYVPQTKIGTDFPIEMGKGYIVNLLSAKTFEITGQPWGTPSAPPARLSNEPWAFVVAGYIDGNVPDNGQIQVTNMRTGEQRIAKISPSGQFTAIFVDMSKRSVVSKGDEIVLQLTSSNGIPLTEMQRYIISNEHIANAFLLTHFLSKPVKTMLLQNYPNPFNPETWIPFQLSQDGQVEITIYNTNGHLVKRLDLGYRQAGWHLSKEQSAYWNGRDESGEKVSSGVYFYCLRTENFSVQRKLVVLK